MSLTEYESPQDEVIQQIVKIIYFTLASLGLLIVIALINRIWPHLIPFTLFEFWHFNFSLNQLFAHWWYLIVWGVGLSVIGLIFTKNHHRFNLRAEAHFGTGMLVSGVAGIFEEIFFRWLLFYTWIIGFSVLFKITFGILEWITVHIESPLANFATAWYTHGILTPYLTGSLGWLVAAAIIASNGKFRDGHTYQGPLGWLNSWFMGMALFAIMFQFGLVAAIIVHFIYDAAITVVVYFDAVFERFQHRKSSYNLPRR